MWNVANLSLGTIRVSASHKLGDDTLEKMAEEIDDMLASALAQLATEIRTTYPDATVRYHV